MLDLPICIRLISETSTRRAGAIRSRRLSTRQCLRTFSVTTRCRAAPQTRPPPAEHVPSARDLQAYLTKIDRGSSLLRSTTEPYAAFGSTEKLFAEISRQAGYTVPNREKTPPEPAPKNDTGEDIGVGTGLWFAPRSQGGLELPVTFMTWAQVMFLYLYIMTVRLRRFPAEHIRIWEQHLMDHFYYAAEARMEKWHGMAARGVRNKNLKDLWQQWRGVLVSYDEGLIKGDAMLAAAVWRSIFKASTDASIEDVALVTAYLRRELQRVDTRTNEQFATAMVEFGDLSTVRSAIAQQAQGANAPFSPADTQAWQALLEASKSGNKQ